TLYGPMDFLPAYCRYHAILPSEPAKKLTPAPANVILVVDENTSGRFGLPAASASPSTSTCFTNSWVRAWTGYALSHINLKSLAAVCICTSRRTGAQECV